MRPLLAVLPILLSTACGDECAFTTSRPVTVTPATSCLSAGIAAPYSNQSIAGCEAPTLVLYNSCTEPVTIAGEATVEGTDVTVDPAAFAEMLIRLDLGTVIGPGLTQLVIPAAIGAGAITLAVVLVKEERTSDGGDDDDDD